MDVYLHKSVSSMSRLSLTVKTDSEKMKASFAVSYLEVRYWVRYWEGEVEETL